MANNWITTPTEEEISSKNNWQKLKNSQWAIGRHHLLIVSRENEQPKKGRVHLFQKIQPGTEYIETSRISKITKYTNQLEQSITKAISTQLTEEVISKLETEFKFGLDIESNINTELQTKITKTLNKSLQHSIVKTETFSIEIEEEKSNSVKIIIPSLNKIKKDVLVSTHYMLREHVWEVYLIQSDYIHLKYRFYKLISWFDIRKTISNYEIKVLKPLFKIIYYVPESRFSISFGSYKAEVENEREIIITPLYSKCPTFNMPPYKSLEKIAQVAFPENQIERKLSKETKKLISGRGNSIGSRRPVKKAAAKKAAPKKAAAKRAAPKKAAPKKAAAKKAARKK